MDFSPSALMQRLADTFREPKTVAAALMARELPAGALWQLVALVVVVSIFLAQLTALLMPMPAGMEMGLFGNPLALGLVQSVLLVALIFGTYAIGRAFGGTGSLSQTTLLVVWLQFVMIALQVLQTLFVVILPPLASLIGIVGLFVFIWLFVNFVAVLHGFNSLALVLVGAVVSVFGVIFVVSIVLTLFGVAGPGM